MVRNFQQSPNFLLKLFLFCTANEFPSSFESIVRKIVRLLFHVVAHLYAAHFKEVVMLGLHAHLNLTFAHLTALQHRFSLIEPKETEVLRDLEVALRLTEDSSSSGGVVGGNLLVETGVDAVGEQLAVGDGGEVESKAQGDKTNGKIWRKKCFNKLYIF